MDDKSLSTYAHNVKMISQNGKVTLKGPVRSEEEKQTIEQKATEVAGAGNVTNEITVKPEKQIQGKSAKENIMAGKNTAVFGIYRDRAQAEQASNA